MRALGSSASRAATTQLRSSAKEMEAELWLQGRYSVRS